MIEEYIKLVDLLEKIVPKNVEIVLHNLKNINKSIVAIKNGHVSGRKIGMPATDLTLEILKNNTDQSVISSYKTYSKYGNQLTSHTFLIKNEQKKLIALLCFNVDTNSLTKPLHEVTTLLQNYLVSLKSDDKVIENFVENEEELFSTQIELSVKKYSVNPEKITAIEKQQIVSELNDKGIFLVKGSVLKVASALNVSTATLYRYLQNIK